MLFKIKSYFKFLVQSTNQHGVHSPFVFDLVTKCFYKKTPKELQDLHKLYRIGLKENQDKIIVTDFGAGSKVFKSTHRKVSEIAKFAGISSKRAKLLIRLTAYFSPKNILEIGTSLGISTAAICLGSEKNVKITTLEGCSETAKIAALQFEHFNLKNIDIITGKFKETLQKVTENKQFDLIYFDGNHQKEATIGYFNLCLKTAHNNSVFIFDDIHWSSEMESAWQQIKEHPSVTVTIDTYQWGIVFFRKEQEKEHFIIRV